MNTIVLRIDPRDPDRARISEVASKAREGKIIAFPTETVYGIGGLASRSGMRETLAQIKFRDPAKPLAYHLSSLDMLASIQVSPTPAVQYLMKKFLPGPFTFLVLNHQGEKVGVRYPRHSVAQLLISAAGGAFWGTSANLSDKPAPRNAQEALDQLDGKIDYLIDSGACELGQESTVIDLTTNPFQIVRRGADVTKIEGILMGVSEGKFPRKKVLVVCTGNSCRSPMAEGWIKNELKKIKKDQEIEVVSCGVGARSGASATVEAVLVMKNREVDISAHRSRTCTRDEVISSDLILAMGPEHATFLQGMVPQVKDKIRLLNIPDPVGMGMMIYEQVFEGIEKKLKACWPEIIS